MFEQGSRGRHYIPTIKPCFRIYLYHGLMVLLHQVKPFNCAHLLEDRRGEGGVTGLRFTTLSRPQKRCLPAELQKPAGAVGHCLGTVLQRPSSCTSEPRLWKTEGSIQGFMALLLPTGLLDPSLQVSVTSDWTTNNILTSLPPPTLAPLFSPFCSWLPVI